ncbi:hypothetical protein LG331_03395 [Vreelandella aquamarina]|uniref:hypothetical protein n=1 Tax=Vreelandella aquamarina TaxID=77097 RepID=UPI00384AF860
MNDQGPHHDTTDHETLKQKGQQSADEIKDAAREQAESVYERQRDNAANHTHTLGTVLKNAADEFDRQQQPFCSEQARKLAGHTERLSQHMRDKDLHSLCRAAEDYGRREPAMFIGGAIAAGFLVTRFLRSSPDKAPAPAASSEASVPDQTL